jgi:transcriptional regulator with XRE-family HTH domain
LEDLKMERSAFGQIVASLRKECLDPHTGRPWTQHQLAEATDLSERIIANLERGEKAMLDGAMLERLAAVFRLTTLERREFFALAVEVAAKAAAAPIAAPGQAADELLAIFAQLAQPAFLYDDSFDILAANHAALVLHGIDPAWLQRLAEESGRPNFLHLIFAPDSPMRRSMQADWRMLAQHNLQQFRAMTLRHRHTARWNELMARLRTLPDFAAEWLAARDAQADFPSRLRVHQYVHPQYAALHYAVMAGSSYAPVDNLHLTVLLPLDKPTFEVFAALYAENRGKYLRWPLGESGN